jgi:hypothetical protein
MSRIAYFGATLLKDWETACYTIVYDHGMLISDLQGGFVLTKFEKFLAGLIGASRSTSYTGLMVARVFHGFGR